MAVNEHIEKLLSATGLPLAYRAHKAYKGKPVPPPPYLVYLFGASNSGGADGKNLFIRSTVRVELYTNKKSPELEAQVESALNQYEFTKDEEYIDSEKMLLVFWEFDIFTKIRRSSNV